ncbi:glycosyltransferase family 2 protein [Synechococcus sp. A15-44]|uniref:glycosyltransferase family 2 protein n=1 Tax=Synechococcus sp. A15-44 TaxID=1050646 RepID=UPI001647B8F9|nr:glycosyltransferase family 2 protein [Synechococcus sp. A15-44]QNI63254.1 glycosyl transferase/ family 2 [Synechococcus sp. A15-44]
MLKKNKKKKKPKRNKSFPAKSSKSWLKACAELAYRKLNNRQEVIKNNCDVICVAANEEAYIAKFIHHYAFQGFSNIFIGINNSTDRTREIAEKIATFSPHVHIFNTNKPQRLHGQRGSYASLFRKVHKKSNSSHCLVVDIDEYWVANPPTMKIDEYINLMGDFDVLFVNWLCTYGQNFLENPINLGDSYRLTAQGKSIFNYKCKMNSLRPHTPNTARHPSEIALKNSAGSLIPWEENEITVASQKSPTLQNTNKPPRLKDSPTSWIIHQIVRSELEYSLSLFTPKCTPPNQLKQETNNPFKTNRKGFHLRQVSANDARLKLLLQDEFLEKKYKTSYLRFLDDHNIAEEVASTEECFSEDFINQKIDSLPASILLEHETTWRKIFSNTRFAEYLERKSRPRDHTNNQPKSI